MPFVVGGLANAPRPPSDTLRVVSTDPPPPADVLDPVLHRLRAGTGPSAATWCRLPGAGARVLVTVTGTAVQVEGAPESVVSGAATQLPLRTRSTDRVLLPLNLHRLGRPDAVLAEARRVLAPHGLVSILVPVPPSFGWRGRAERRSLRRAWRSPSCVEHPDWVAASADLAVLADDTLTFTLDGAGDLDALCRAGVYPGDLPARVLDALRRHRTASHTVRLRRIVARR